MKAGEMSAAQQKQAVHDSRTTLSQRNLNLTLCFSRLWLTWPLERERGTFCLQVLFQVEVEY